MESLDPPNNIANVGKSWRRISSILKAPRTSVDFADPELVETPVQVAIPVEKRNSRRVSFAPANDVLLFSKENRNGSPVRSPLQDLNAANNPDNRNPIGVIEKGKQPIADMENLLYAPLQTSQQRKEVSMVSHDAEDLYGEKTMMFAAHDADMDLTHSQTVWITNDSALPNQDGEMLPTCANMDFFMSMDKKKGEPCILPKITSSSVQHFDPDFEKLLASFSKPTVPKDNFMLHKVDQNALIRPHDKENQAPTFMATRRENLPHKTAKFGESSNRGVPSEDTQGMEMTDVLTGPIVENATADNPLQCLFPTLDLYRHSEHREPVERNGQQQGFEALKCSLSNSNDETKTKISVADPKKYRLGVSSLKMGNSLNLNLTQTCPPDNRMISQNKNVQNVLQSSDSDDMDMTRSQTVAIDSKSLHAVTTMTKQGMSRFSITAPYKNSADFELDIDFTRCQTGVIEAKDIDLGKPSYTVNAGGSVRIIADKQQDWALSQVKMATDHFEIDNMEMTQSQTAAIVSLHRVEPLQMSQDKKSSEKWNDSEDDDMEFTTCDTKVFETKDVDVPVKRASTSFMSAFTKAFKQNTLQNEFGGEMPESLHSNTLLHSEDAMDGLTSRREGFERYNCESDDMEMTKSQTVAIDAKNLNSVKSLGNRRKSLAFAATCTEVDDVPEDGYCKDKIQTNTDTDLEMEFTRCQTSLIETKHLTFVKPSLKISSGKCFPTLDSNAHLPISMNAVENSKSYQNGANIFPEANQKNERHTMSFSCDKVTGRRDGFEHYNCESDDMEMTKSQTVAIDAKNLNAVKTFGNNRRKSLAFADTYAKVAEDGYCEDKIQTDTETDSEMEFTRCQTRLIETKQLTFVKPSLIFPEANQEIDRHTLCSEDMELTKSQTVALNCKSSGISNILFHSGRKSLALLKEKSPGMHVNVINMSSSESQNPDEMDITRSHTVAIQSKDVHRPDDASLNNFQVTGPPEGLSPNHSGSAEELGVRLKNRAHGLAAFGGMNLAQNGTIPIQLNKKETTLSKSMFSLDGKVTKVSDLTDQLDSSQKEVKSITLSVDKNSPGNANAFGESSETVATQNKNGSDLGLENCSLSSGLESTPCIEAEVDRVDEASLTKSRRMSLVDLQFKLKRMSRLLNEPTEKFAADVCDVPLSQPKSASGRISDKTHLTAPQHYPETQMTDNADYTQPEQPAEEQRPCVTAPLNLNRRSLTSRLSMGNLLPKLPPKIKPADRNKVSSSCRMPGKEHNEVATHQLSSSMSDNIVDEVLPNISSDEDLSMVTENPQSTNEDGSPLHGRDVQSTSEEEVWELSPGHPSDTQCKRPSPVDGEDMMATEKRRRISSDSTIEMPNQSPEEGTCIGKPHLTPALTTKAIDVPNRSTSQLRSETTFESTLKQSLFESQLEVNMDYTNEFQKNIADERITVSEFFQLLNMDFVIHNPRQSILPGKLASHLGHTPEDLLKNRHVNHPKQIVYEADHKNLAEKVERLKARMKDQGRLLQTVNQPLWEELKCFSEDELKRFGSKMKERSNFFRKRIKAQSHEMKEALYSNLLQANLEERQKLRGKMEEADGMLKSLDDCIQELETELAVEENGSDDSKLTLKSSQLGLEKVTMELADKERQMCEMEVQKKCNMDQVKRLQTEIQELNGHITLLHRVNEWKVAERRANCDIYSFLYGSLHLEVVFDTGAVSSKGPDEVNERNILDINFKLELDEEKSECHARLVHTLLSEFTTGRSDWLGKYPSSRCVPKLLHDVALVVSRCRLLGEEVRLLRTWGALKFDILDIRCVDTRVHIVFSSLEAGAEFELSLVVTMAYPGCPLQLQDFKNHIGTTTVRRIEEIVSSVSPGKNYLTKIVKAIHAAVHS